MKKKKEKPLTSRVRKPLGKPGHAIKTKKQKERERRPRSREILKDT